MRQGPAEQTEHPMKLSRETRQRERRYVELLDTMDEQKAEISRQLLTAQVVPQEWLRLHREAPTARKRKKVTIGYDEDVVAFYRSLGRGYQRRMNAILRAYMNAILTDAIRTGPSEDWRGRKL
jgi:uncharacterized protein (DUF4415 family)